MKKSILFFVALSFACSQPADLQRNIESSLEDVRYRIDVFGDSRDGEHVFSQLMQLANTRFGEHELLYSFHLGDLISRPSRQDQLLRYQHLIKAYMPQGTFLPVVGNHDVDSKDTLAHFQLAWPVVTEKGYYARSIEDGFFIALNTTKADVIGALGPTQLEWLAATLASPQAQAASYRIVAMHHPIDQDAPLGQYLHQLYREHNVQMVFFGHMHVYHHSVRDDVHYVISGGSGSPLHGAFGEEAAFFHYVRLLRTAEGMKADIIDIFGEQRDTFHVDF